MSGYAQAEAVRNESGCWYRIDVEECPVCARHEEHRTRMPAPAPEPHDRYVFHEAYDFCLEREALAW